MLFAKLRRHSRRQRFLTKLISICCTAILLTVVLVAGLLSHFFRNSALEDFRGNQSHIVTQYAALFADLNQASTMASSILLSSADVVSALDGTAHHPYEIFKLNTQVRNVLTQYPLIHSISLINTTNQFFFNTHMDNQAYIESDLQSYFHADSPPPYYRFLARRIADGDPVLSMVIPYGYVREPAGGNGRRSMVSGIVINIPADAFLSTLPEDNAVKGSTLLVLGDSDILCASSSLDREVYSQFPQLIRNVTQCDSGTADIELAGTRYLVVYAQGAQYTLADVIDYSHLFRNTKVLTARIFVVCLLISIVILALIFVLIRKTYRPLGHVVTTIVEHFGEPFISSGDEVEFVRLKFDELRENMQKIAGQLAQSHPYIKKQLLTGLLNGNDSKRNMQMLKEYFPGLLTHECYQVLLLVPAPCEDGDMNAAVKRLEVEKLITEQLDGKDFIVFEENADSIIVICGMDGSGDALCKASLLPLRKKLLDHGLKTVICIGTQVGDIRELPDSYISAQNLLNSRFIFGLDVVIDHHDVEALETSAFMIQGYLDKLQASLKSANRTGLISDMNTLFNRIEHCCYDLAMLAVNSLLYHIIEIVNQLLRVESGEESPLNTSNIHLNLTRLQTLAEVKEYLITIGLALIDKIERARDTYKYTLYESIIAFVDENLCDNALSLDMVGEHLGFSPGYISKIFNAFQSCSIVEYINQARIELAKMSLLETKDTVATISKAVGFQSSGYFISTFKKHVGTTPNAFRKGGSAYTSNAS